MKTIEELTIETAQNLRDWRATQTHALCMRICILALVAWIVFEVCA